MHIVLSLGLQMRKQTWTHRIQLWKQWVKLQDLTQKNADLFSAHLCTSVHAHVCTCVFIYICTCICMLQTLFRYYHGACHSGNRQAICCNNRNTYDMCMLTDPSANTSISLKFPPSPSLLSLASYTSVDLISPNRPPSRLTSYSSLPAVFPLEEREISGAKFSRRLSGTSVGTLKL